MMPRPDGYYWVHHAGMGWIVAEWEDGEWWLTGSDLPTWPPQIVEVDERKLERN